MDKILLIMVIAGQPQLIYPMDSSGDCITAVKIATKVHDSMLWCGRGGCSGKDVQLTCWDPKENKPIEIPVDVK